MLTMLVGAICYQDDRVLWLSPKATLPETRKPFYTTTPVFYLLYGDNG